MSQAVSVTALVVPDKRATAKCKVSFIVAPENADSSAISQVEFVSKMNPKPIVWKPGMPPAEIVFLTPDISLEVTVVPSASTGLTLSKDWSFSAANPNDHPSIKLPIECPNLPPPVPEGSAVRSNRRDCIDAVRCGMLPSDEEIHNGGRTDDEILNAAYAYSLWDSGDYPFGRNVESFGPRPTEAQVRAAEARSGTDRSNCSIARVSARPTAAAPQRQQPAASSPSTTSAATDTRTDEEILAAAQQYASWDAGTYRLGVHVSTFGPRPTEQQVQAAQRRAGGGRQQQGGQQQSGSQPRPGSAGASTGANQQQQQNPYGWSRSSSAYGDGGGFVVGPNSPASPLHATANRPGSSSANTRAPQAAAASANNNSASRGDSSEFQMVDRPGSSGGMQRQPSGTEGWSRSSSTYGDAFNANAEAAGVNHRMSRQQQRRR